MHCNPPSCQGASVASSKNPKPRGMTGPRNKKRALRIGTRGARRDAGSRRSSMDDEVQRMLELQAAAALEVPAVLRHFAPAFFFN